MEDEGQTGGNGERSCQQLLTFCGSADSEWIKNSKQRNYCCTLSLTSKSGSEVFYDVDYDSDSWWVRGKDLNISFNFWVNIQTQIPCKCFSKFSVFSYKRTIFHCVGGVKASRTLAHHCIISNCIVTYWGTCNCTDGNNLSDSPSRALKPTFQKPPVGEPSVT